MIDPKRTYDDAEAARELRMSRRQLRLAFPRGQLSPRKWRAVGGTLLEWMAEPALRQAPEHSQSEGG